MAYKNSGEEAMQEFKDAFNDVDLNARGKLTMAELTPFLKSL